MDVQSTNVNGKTIRHKDVIHYSTTSSFTWKQRLKILFGKKVSIYSVLFTMNNKIEMVDTATMTVIGDNAPPMKAAAAQPVAEKQLRAV
jgi:hypothetical protein